ncbi:hypothetical protein FKZ61_012470 [Litorilinea aerophila]|uniref:Glycosyltransferase family 4 protein n=1 Tax=Litorilinea aerophila TaxID=1204385 RepID=A0A540VF65_9CHLR|nr:hypothetical protein [Litorilinea aerophila]MCC9076919.1 hypothetical protein [Litorilinea aerophila]
MPDAIPLVIHATHEAGVKVGGIGAVLDGLLSAESYVERVPRTVLVGPMQAGDPVYMERLTDPRNGLTIRYSSLHGIFDGLPEVLRAALQGVERQYQVGVLYGVRRFGPYEHEVILVDATAPNRHEADLFRYYVWQRYGIDCARYSWNPEFNLYFDIAQPLFAAIKALGMDVGLEPDQKFIIAHEWLGMPVVFAAQLSEPARWRTIFYAHETATARRLIEEHDGHDTRFYNVLHKAEEWNLDLESIFGNQDDLFKHPILKAAVHCDNIFAVGDLVVQELRFLGGRFRQANIDLVYNGIPAPQTTLEEKLASKRRLQAYCEALLGYSPDYVFTHVTRMVLSKALWRDIRVMEHLEGMLQAAGKRAVLFVLSTSVPAGRRPEWVEAWEAQYGWPVGHRADNGDLIDLEVPFFFDGVEPFNRQARQSQIVLVNQFGWSRSRCGRRMPADMEFLDIRQGTDLEFGQSIYEPFGIAQVEPLGYGALCCVSNVCGCVGFVERAAGGQEEIPNLVVADYTTLPQGYWLGSPYDALAINRSVRDWIESHNSLDAARTLFERLPQDSQQMAHLLRCGQEVAQHMSWDVVARDYLLPGLERARQRNLQNPG